jgi:preprotein translocase subunit SecG
METLVLVLHVLAALGIIGLVLLQHGKGADMGAAFGGGASGSLFGATGSANFLSRITAVLATIFFATSLGLTWFSSHKIETKGVMATQPAAQAPVAAPAATPAATEVPVPTPDRPAGEADSKAKDIPK